MMIGRSAISQPKKKEEKMTVHVIIKRKLIIDKPDKIFPLLSKLHTLGMQQPGYIDSMTLKNIDKPEEHMIISTWETVDDWNAWFQGKDRRDLQGQVDSLVGERTQYSIYKDVTH
jgi:heme-degrading monooxygenase HmoA